MKRILLLMILMLTVLTGCNKNKNHSVNDVVKYLEGLDSYSLTSTMKINKEDKTISLDVTVDYLAPNYYKVVFGNDNEQIIIKNSELFSASVIGSFKLLLIGNSSLSLKILLIFLSLNFLPSLYSSRALCNCSATNESFSTCL